MLHILKEPEFTEWTTWSTCIDFKKERSRTCISKCLNSNTNDLKEIVNCEYTMHITSWRNFSTYFRFLKQNFC